MQLLDSLTAVPAPLESDPDGVFRVTGTRVRLDTVLTAFHQGSSAEEIVLKFPSLRLTDVYSVITYYLWRRQEVDEYLQQRRALIVERPEEYAWSRRQDYLGIHKMVARVENRRIGPAACRPAREELR